MLKDASRRKFDVLAVWSIDRLGRSTSAVVTAMDDLEESGVNIYADKEGVDATTSHGRAMLEMAAVFARLERSMIRERVIAGLARARAQGRQLGRPRVSADVEDNIRLALADGRGMVSVARELGVGVSVVQRVRRVLDQEKTLA
jgi:DNA invertase Pin-like site-specific DNA recombinase